MCTVATLDGFSNGTVVVERGDALRCQRLLTKEGGRHGAIVGVRLSFSNGAPLSETKLKADFGLAL